MSALPTTTIDLTCVTQIFTNELYGNIDQDDKENLHAAYVAKQRHTLKFEEHAEVNEFDKLNISIPHVSQVVTYRITPEGGRFKYEISGKIDLST